jgi:hypothetical protein
MEYEALNNKIFPQLCADARQVYDIKGMSLKFSSVGSLGEQQLVKNQDHHKEMIVPRLEWRSRFLTLLSPHLHNTKLP